MNTNHFHCNLIEISKPLSIFWNIYLAYASATCTNGLIANPFQFICASEPYSRHIVCYDIRARLIPSLLLYIHAQSKIVALVTPFYVFEVIALAKITWPPVAVSKMYVPVRTVLEQLLT